MIDAMFFDCYNCNGLGIVEDPQHGHSFKCERCAGKGKLETCQGYALGVGNLCIRKKKHTDNCFSIDAYGKGYFIRDESPPMISYHFVDVENWPDDIPSSNHDYYLWGSIVDRRAAVEATKVKNGHETESR